MYIQTGQVFKWRQRKRKGNIVSILNRYLVMMPLVLISTAGIALAEPTGGVITGGSGTITQVESATNISQASPRLDINWRTFSTEVHESVNFTQPTADALAINRVIGGVPSELRGALNANGRVVILNDSGITFFGTSQVNVGALLATTATNLSTDGDRLSFSGAGYGTVLNQGSILVSDGGFAVLAAPYVSNTGFIQAKLGTIQLSSANDFTVDFRGDGLIGFTVSKSTLDGIVEAGKPLGVDNTGTLLAGSGTIGISAAAASSIVQSVVNLDGVVDASSFGAGTNGGTVLVTSVGDINIDGVVHADGGVSGNGGTVTTWADATNVFGPGAVITARGGDTSGDGGFIEVSGHDVRVRGTVNASATNGAAGTFRIDPFNLIIADGAGSDSTATVFEQNIEATSVGGTNVDLVADHDITMNDLTTDGVLQGGDGAITMTSTFGGTISFADLNDKIATTGGAITITANDGAEGFGMISVGDLQTTGSNADITLTAGNGGVGAGNLQTLRSNADITITAAGTGGIMTGNLSTGTDPLISGFGTAQPGAIILTTTNGGSITTGNISIHAEAFDSADAYLNADAAGDLSVGNVSVVAIDPTSPASASVGLRSAGGSVTAGDVTVTADGFNGAEAHLSMFAGSGDVNAGFIDVKADTDTLDANATAFINALAGEGGGDIHLTGHIYVDAETFNGGDDTASANAKADIVADNDVTIDYGAVVNAIADNHVDYNASATADLQVSAGHDLTLFGGIAVNAYALDDNTEVASDANATANLNMTASNDMHIVNGVLVSAEASLVTSGTNEADADATANFSANNITFIQGIGVKAVATQQGVGSVSDIDRDAKAILTAHANNDLSITEGDIIVSASSTLTGSAQDSAWAFASADLSAGYDLTVTGNTTVEAVALADGTTFGADAEAYLRESAGNDLTITGDIMVNADATSKGIAATYNYCSYWGCYSYDRNYASADASADLSASRDITIVADPVTVKATALNEAVNGSDASASAYLHVNYENESRDLNITGETLVTASATLGADGADSASASASVDLYAGNNVTVNGNITVEATAVNNGTNGSDASADAYLYVNAGNDLTINGNTLVSANAKMAAGTDSADASAYADLYAGNDVNINGGLTVTATAVNNATYYADDASADADLYVDAGNDINITGDVLVKAEATLGAGGWDSADASATADLYAGRDVNVNGDLTVTAIAVNNGTDASSASASAELYVGAGRDLNITGDVLVKADVTCASCAEDSGSADGYLYLNAGHDMNIKGDVKLIVNALVNQGSDADAYAYMSAYANNDLNITGDILVRSDATMGGNDDANASAYAYISAGHNVTLLTDPVTVSANAVSYSGNAYANAQLNIEAGRYDGCDGECTPAGDLYITGDVLAIATATVTNPSSSDGYYYTHSSEYASVSLRAPDSITNLYGTAPPTAYAPNPNDPAHALAQSNVAGFFSDWFGSYSDGAEGYAQLNIEAASVSIEPKPAVAATQPVEDNEHEVVSSLETKEIRLIEPLGPGKDPLSFDADGLALWATGAGVTAPSMGSTLTPDIEEAIAKGIDPTTILPAPAAGGGMGLSSGADAYSVGGPDFCDQVVSGYCLPQEGKKKIE